MKLVHTNPTKPTKQINQIKQIIKSKLIKINIDYTLDKNSMWFSLIIFSICGM